MIKKISIITVLVLLGLRGFSQNELNNYKYLVVPHQYEFLKGKDQYRLNTLTRFLFQQKGYLTYFDDEELPDDLFGDRCLGMYANVKKIKGFLTTKLQIELKDCKGNVIMISQIGKTKEKDYKKAYHIALRQAFETFDFLSYEYNPKDIPLVVDAVKDDKARTAKIVSDADKSELERLRKEVERLKKNNDIQDNDEFINQKEEGKSTILKENILFAQPIENGFQIIDMEPKKVMVLLKTETENVFKVEGREAIVFKKGEQWIYAETKASKTTERVLNIRF